MHASRVIGGGLGVVVAIALGAAGSVSPPVNVDQPVTRAVAVIAQRAKPSDQLWIAASRGHASLIAWSE